MFRTVIVGATIMFSTLSATLADDVVKPQIVESKLFHIKTLTAARSLSIKAERVELSFVANDKDSMKEVDAILGVLAEKPDLRELTINIPNASKFPADSLDRLKEFKNIETLTIRDARESKSEKFYEQVAAVKGVKELNLAFL